MVRSGEAVGWLADGTIPNSLYRVPFFYLFLACALCYCSFLFVTFLFLCSRWSFVDVPLNFSCLGYNTTASDAWIPTLIVVCIFTLIVCVCVFVFSSHPFWTSSSLDVPAGVTQEEGHTGFLIHLPSAVRALIFVARRIQPFLSLVDREVEFCVLTN